MCAQKWIITGYKIRSFSVSTNALDSESYNVAHFTEYFYILPTNAYFVA